jgi:glycosyltransferase involved in cell wall biosynthesis
VKIALFGGLFESSMNTYAASAPEAVLLHFLRQANRDVVPMSAGRRPSLGVAADVYHFNHFGVAAYYAALAGVRPFVFTSHNPFLVSSFALDESRIDHFLQRLVMRHADAIVALSAREAELLSERFGVRRERFTVIPNGLDLSLYGPATVVSRGGFEILSVGQLQPYKGYEFLFEAVALLAPSYPELRLTIVSHQQALRAQYERRCDELGIAARVSFAGPLTTRELAERYRSADLYVQPSLAECFPVTVLEAMASGKAVVATDVGGVAEELGDAGVLVPPGDVPSLADAIRRLLEDPEERAALGEKALARSSALYDGRRVADLHVSLYESLVPRRARPSIARRTLARTVLGMYGRRGMIGPAVPRFLRRRRVAA